MDRYDLAVIGSGPGGYRAAVLGALQGLRVVIVERGTWGGCCLNRGCVPKRAWYEAARTIDLARDGATRGITGHVSGDLAAAWRHQRAIVDRTREGYVDYLARLGVARVEGAARFLDRGTLAVGATGRIVAGHVIVATGSQPVVPRLLPRDGVRVLTTDDLFDAPPPAGRRVAVLGSGAVATELAYSLTLLGREVAWISRAAPLASGRFSLSARRVLEAAFDRVPVARRHRGRVVRAAIGADCVRLETEDGSAIDVDWVVLGTGRVPCTDGLGLDAAEIEVDAEGFIPADAMRRSAVAGIHAIGDVSRREMTSNHALADAAVAIADLLGTTRDELPQDAVPECIYAACELARAGAGEEEAEDAGREVATGFAAFESNPAALAAGRGAGFVRLVADADTGVLLGAEIAGDRAADLVALVAPRIGRADALSTLSADPCVHPSHGEELRNAAETLASRWGLGAAVFGRAVDGTRPE